MVGRPFPSTHLRALRATIEYISTRTKISLNLPMLVTREYVSISLFQKKSWTGSKYFIFTLFIHLLSADTHQYEKDTPHTAGDTKKLLAELRWDVLPHPSHSPDMS